MRGFVAAVVTAGSAAPCPADPPLVEYASEAGGFRVAFPPGRPTREVTDVASPAGVLRVTTERVDAGRGLSLAVSVTDYPPGADGGDPRRVLDGVRDGLKGLDGRVRAEADRPPATEAGPLPGREVIVDLGRKSVRCRAFLDGRRLYQVLAAGDRDAVRGSPATDFLDSFRLDR